MRKGCRKSRGLHGGSGSSGTTASNPWMTRQVSWNAMSVAILGAGSARLLRAARSNSLLTLPVHVQLLPWWTLSLRAAGSQQALAVLRHQRPVWANFIKGASMRRDDGRAHASVICDCKAVAAQEQGLGRRQCPARHKRAGEPGSNAAVANEGHLTARLRRVRVHLDRAWAAACRANGC